MFWFAATAARDVAYSAMIFLISAMNSSIGAPISRFGSDTKIDTARDLDLVTGAIVIISLITRRVKKTQAPPKPNLFSFLREIKLFGWRLISY